MASSHHVEMEAAKFLQKLIQDSKDEPLKLATKLYVICQHMKISGKEQSLPYQVISRAMETVINQHGIDIEVLKSSRLPLTGGPQIGDSGNARSMDKDAPDNPAPIGASDIPFRGAPVSKWHAASSSEKKEEVYGGSVQSVGILKDSKTGLSENEMARHDAINPHRPPVGLSRVESGGHDFYQGSISQRSNNLFEHESPSSLDTRSANSQERRDTAKLDKQGHQKSKKTSAKRKRADSTSATDAHTDNLQQLDNPNTGFNPRKGKVMNKGDAQGHFTVKGGDHDHASTVQNSGHVEHMSLLSSGMGSIFRAKQENPSFSERSMEKTQITNSLPMAPTSKYPEEGEGSAAHGAVGHQKGGLFLSRHDTVNPRSVWNQFKVGLPSENSQFSRFAPNVVSSSTAEISMPQSTAPSIGTNKEAVTIGNEMKTNIYDSKLTENKVFEFSGQSSEGTVLNKAGKFWQQRVPHSAQTIGGEFLNNEAELGGPGRSPVVNSNASHGITGISGGIGKVHGGMSGPFSSYAMVKTGFSAPIQFSSSLFDSHDLASNVHKERSTEASSGSQLLEKSKDMMATDASMKSPSIDLSSAKVAVDSEHRKSGFMKDAELSISEKVMEAQLGSVTRGEETLTPLSVGKVLEQDGGILHAVGNTYKMVQGSGYQGHQIKENLDTGKTSMSPPVSSGMPFKEQQLKQLRAQCLVFLAFRNGLVPRKLHLEIALGDSSPKEDGARRELNDNNSLKEPSSSNEATGAFGRPNDIRETERIPPSSSSTGSLIETESSSKDTENPKKMKNKKGLPADRSVLTEERKRLLAARRKSEAEMQAQEMAESEVALAKSLEPESPMNSGRISAESNHDKDDPENSHQLAGRANQVCSSVLGINKQLKPEMTSLTGIGSYNEAFRETLVASMVQHDSVPGRIDNPLNHSQALGDGVGYFFKSETPVMQANQSADKYPSAFLLKDKPILGKDAEYSRDVNLFPTHVSQGESHTSKSDSIISNSFADAFVSGGNCGPDDQRVFDIQKQCTPEGCKMVTLNDTLKYGNPVTVLEKYTEQEEDNKSLSSDTPSPKYTTSEKWIMDQQKRKLIEEQNWALKQRKTGERIAVCFDKLKETVSSSEDISAKTRSVIELKKLQLLQLQRRLRSDFLHDFFKPISSDMERLKSIKKHRYGRRMKQLEKFEQKMKEERQKRIRERQKEFFSEIEVHKERLDDWFKIKRERWKGFNKYVKEFHKRKERIHREKIDRIQREKINLLKNNDVEGYLRMVQDAKSDRVKQLLKETEKYLQKLGSKLRDAKALSRKFELEMDENQASTVVEKNDIAVENEDESDQAEHYLESNEKYYLMAHSIKEGIAEQPTSLQGGKLREYQMNGLRWLVSLYNNHLNGILADEMGLGKTVQVIALICYLMETKNDRGPFLVVVPSSVLSGWETEISFWAPGINKIAYAGPPEERRRLFKERIVQQKFNVLLTTYEYLMNKHDRPKLCKVNWHYIIIDEGHRIKNASCKLNADLRHYQSSHRLLLTGTPLQNNLEELWALLNFLLPNIFNSSEDFSQWFNKPFESSGDTSPDQALLSEEENLLIINRLHQVLRPFVLRRLKHKVENQLPEKIERLVRCEASAYQNLLMKRVEDNLGTIGSSKGRAVHNSVMELRNICNHPYISQLHAEEIDSLIPKHYLPPIVRLCGKLEMLDRLLPKLKATDHRVLFFSTMTRLLDVMEEYLRWKRYRYLRLDGHTSGGDRGALIEEFNRPDSAAFIFLLSIRAGGVGVNLQAADTVIIFDTDWNPQVDLQAQARAHRIGQKRDVLVLRFETVRTVEEQVRAAAEHKLGVANQSITAGFFDNNTSAEDRREYLESLLRECKKEEVAPVLDDDALNDLLARSESEIDIFESIDKQRREEEMASWQKLVQGPVKDGSEPLPPMPSRLVTDHDLKAFYKAMQIYEESNAGVKRKSEHLGGLDTQQYGRGKRAREVRSYEDQWTEEEFEKMCQVDSPESPKLKEGTKDTSMATDASESKVALGITEQTPPPPPPPQPPLPSKEPLPPSGKEPALPPPTPPPPPPPPPLPPPLPSKEPLPPSDKEPAAAAAAAAAPKEPLPPPGKEIQPPSRPPPPPPSKEPLLPSGKELQPPSRRGRGRPKRATIDISPSAVVLPPSATVSKLEMGSQRESIPISTTTPGPDTYPGSITIKGQSETTRHEFGVGTAPGSLTTTLGTSVPTQVKGQGRKAQGGLETPRRRAKKQSSGSPAVAPEINPISRISKEKGMASDSPPGFAFGQDKQQLVSRPSGTSNAPTVIGPVINPLSRIPTAMTLASDSSPSAFSQDKQKVSSRPSGTSNAPTIVGFEVNPVSGLQKVVELVPVRTPIPSLAQEKYKSVVPVLEKKETERVVPTSDTKVGPSETISTARTDRIGSVELKKNEGLKVSVMHGGQVHKVDQSSTPVVSALAQDLMERRTLRMGSVDMMSGKKQKPSDKPESASIQSVQKAGPGLNPSKAEPEKSSRGNSAAHLELPVVKPVESVTRQDNMCIGSALVMSSHDMNDQKSSVPASSRQTRSSAEKDKSKVPVAVKRGPKKKDLGVTNNKQAVSGVKSSTFVQIALPTAHAYSVGSLEAEKNNRPMEAIITRDKQETDANKPRNVTSGKAYNSRPDMISGQKPSPTEKSDFSAPNKQEVGASIVQKNAAISMEKNSACTEANEGQVPLQSKVEELPLEAGLSQTPVDSSLSAGLTLAGGMDYVASVTKASVDSCSAESKNGEFVGSKAIIMTDKQETNIQKPGNVHSEQACNIRLLGIKSGQDPNSTEKSDYSAQSKQQSGLSTMLQNAGSAMDNSSACIVVNEVKAPVESKDEGLQVGLSLIPEDPPSSSGRTEAGGINDVSVMKEVLFETCSSETRSGESKGSKDGDILATPVTSRIFTEGTKSHLSENLNSATLSSIDTVSPVSNLPVEKHENRSTEENAANPPEGRGPIESLADDTTAITSEVNVKVKVGEAETELVSGSVENLADSGQLSQEKSLPAVSMVVTYSVPVGAYQNVDVSCDKPLAYDGEGAVAPNDSCTGASSMQVDASLESKGDNKSPVMTKNDTGSKAEFVPNESPQSSLLEVNNECTCTTDTSKQDLYQAEFTMRDLHLVKSSVDLVAEDMQNSEAAVGHYEICYAGPAENQSTLEIKRAMLVVDNLDNPVNRQVEVEESVTPPKINIASTLDPSEPAGVLSRTNGAESNHDAFVSGVVECALEEPKNVSAVDELAEVGFASVSEKSEEPDGTTILGQSEVPDRPNTAAIVSVSGLLSQLDEQISYPCSTHGATDDIVGPVDPEIPGKTDDSKRLEGTAIHSESEAQDLPNSAPSVSACDQVPPPYEQIPDPPSSHSAGADSAGSMNSENPGKEDDSKKHESTTTLGQNKVPDLPDTAPSVSLCGQILQLDKQIVDLPSTHSPGVDSAGSMNPENYGKAGSKKHDHDSTTALGQSEVPDLPDTTLSVSLCGQVPQPEEQIVDPPSTHCAGADSAGSMIPDDPGKADDSRKHESTTALGQSEVPDLSNTAPAVSAFDRVPELDEQAPNSSSSYGAGNDSEDSLNPEKADDSNGVSDSTRLCHMKDPDHQVSVASHAASSNEDKMERFTLKATDTINGVIGREGPTNSEKDDNGGDRPGIVLTEPAGTCGIVDLHGVSSDGDMLHGDTSLAADVRNECINPERPLYPERAGDGGDLPGVAPTVTASGQDTLCDDMNLEATCVESEDNETPVLEAVPSGAVESCILQPVPEGRAVQQPALVESSNKEAPVLEAVPSVAAESCSSEPVPEDCCEVQRLALVESSNKEAPVLEAVPSVAAESCSSEPVPEDCCEVQRLALVESSNKEAPVLEAVPSVAAESCLSEPVPEDCCEVQQLVLVEISNKEAPAFEAVPSFGAESCSPEPVPEDCCEVQQLALVESSNKEAPALEAVSSVAAESCSPEPVPEDCCEVQQLALVESSNKEAPALEAMSSVAAESCSSEPVPEDCCEVQQPALVESSNKEASVLESVPSVAAESCSSEPVPKDRCEVPQPALVETSTNSCDENHSKEASVLESVPSVAAESCCSEPVPKDLCEDPQPAFVETSTNSCDENHNKEANPSVTEVSPRQVVDDCIEDREAAGMPIAEKNDLMDTQIGGVEALGGSVDSLSSSAREENEKIDGTSEKVPSGSSVTGGSEGNQTE